MGLIFTENCWVLVFTRNFKDSTCHYTLASHRQHQVLALFRWSFKWNQINQPSAKKRQWLPLAWVQGILHNPHPYINCKCLQWAFDTIVGGKLSLLTNHFIQTNLLDTRSRHLGIILNTAPPNPGTIAQCVTRDKTDSAHILHLFMWFLFGEKFSTVSGPPGLKRSS